MIINGTNASQSLPGTSGDDIITGFGGNDSLDGLDGNDIYFFSGAFGRDQIIDRSGIDQIQFGADLSPSSFRIIRGSTASGDLIIEQTGTDNSVTLNRYFFMGTNVGAVESILFLSTGTVWNLSDASAFINPGFIGTNAAENIVGTSNNDFIVGNGGNDTLSGLEGNDTYYFTGAFGRDVINDSAGSDIAYIGSDYTEANFRFLPPTSSTDLVMQQINGQNSIAFDRYYSGGQKVESVYFGATGTTWDLSTGNLIVRPGKFDYNGYYSANPDVRALGFDGYVHYVNNGWREGRDPSAGFDTTLYLKQNPDVAAAGVNPLIHYLTVGQYEGRQVHAAVGLVIEQGFDAKYYLLANPDVGLANLNPAQHYATNGWHEGRNPNYIFDTKFYLLNNPDVAASGINPLLHYDSYGWKEGRDPSATFHTKAYLTANPDVAAALIDPMQHYLAAGVYEGRVIG